MKQEHENENMKATKEYNGGTELGDAAAIWCQLDGLMTIYSEVLKLLKFGPGGPGGGAGNGPL